MRGVTLACLGLALSTATADTLELAPKPADEAAVESLIASYQRSLQEVFEQVPSQVPDPTSEQFILSLLKSHVMPVVGWGRIEPDGEVIALTRGWKGGCWILILQSGHPWLQQPSPTLSTSVIDGMVSIVVRPDLLSNDFAGVFLTHELLHAYVRQYKPPIPDGSEEQYAYDAERRALNAKVGGRLDNLLSDTVRKFELRDENDMLDVTVSNPRRTLEILNFVDAGLALSPPASTAERQMRNGVFIVMLTDWLAEARGATFEQRVQVLSRLLDRIGLHKPASAAAATN